jgi:hypothetical protein
VCLGVHYSSTLDSGYIDESLIYSWNSPLLKLGLTATDENDNRARSYREQVLEEHNYDT